MDHHIQIQVGGGNGNGRNSNATNVNGNAGFTGYRRAFPNSNSGIIRLSDLGMGLPVQMQPLPASNININNNNSSYSSPAAADAAGEAGSAAEAECTVREQDRFMPIANVIRIMRKILPPHAKISDDAKETIQECVSEYISFITGEANDRCQREQRKTITAEDVLWAMSKLGFDDYIEPLTLYLHRHREFDGADRGSSSLRTDQLGKRPVDHSAAAATTLLGIAPPGTPPCYGALQHPHFHLPREHPTPGFFGPATAAVPANGFPTKNHHSSSNGNGGAHSSSQQQQALALVDNGEQPFGGQCKE